MGKHRRCHQRRHCHHLGHRHHQLGHFRCLLVADWHHSDNCLAHFQCHLHRCLARCQYSQGCCHRPHQPVLRLRRTDHRLDKPTRQDRSCRHCHHLGQYCRQFDHCHCLTVHLDQLGRHHQRLKCHRHHRRHLNSLERDHQQLPDSLDCPYWLARRWRLADRHHRLDQFRPYQADHRYRRLSHKHRLQHRRQSFLATDLQLPDSCQCRQKRHRHRHLQGRL